MPTKWYWVMHGRLTRERKAYTSHRHSSITRPLPAARALKHQDPCLIGPSAARPFSYRANVAVVTRDGYIEGPTALLEPSPGALR